VRRQDLERREELRRDDVLSDRNKMGTWRLGNLICRGNVVEIPRVFWCSYDGGKIPLSNPLSPIILLTKFSREPDLYFATFYSSYAHECQCVRVQNTNIIFYISFSVVPLTSSRAPLSTVPHCLARGSEVYFADVDAICVCSW